MPERKEITIEEMGALSKNIHGNLFPFQQGRNSASGSF